MRIRKRQLLNGLGHQPAFKIRRLSEQVSSVVSTEEAATECEAKLKEAEAKVVSLEKELGIAMLDVYSLEKEKEKLRLTKAHTEAQVGKLERELKSLADSHSAEREALQTQVVELESSLAGKRKELRLTEAQVGKLERELNSLADSNSAEKEALQTQVVELESSFAGNRKELRLTKAHVGKLERELNLLADSHLAEKEALQTQVVELESSLAERSEELEAAVKSQEEAANKFSSRIVMLESLVAIHEENSKLQKDASRSLLEKLVALETKLNKTAARMVHMPRRQSSMVILVETVIRKTVCLEVESLETIRNVKEKVQEKLGIRPDMYQLIFGEKILDDGLTVAEYNIHKDDTLHSRRANSQLYHGPFQIFVRKSVDETFSLEVESSDTIFNVKTKIQDEERIPPKQQRLFFDGCNLADERTLAYCNIQFCSILYLSSH